jgi:hypothetical protein
MEQTAEIKNALANFLGFAMSKSKELDSAIIPGSNVSKNNTNIDYLITKAATEVEQKFGNNYQSPPSQLEVTDIASQIIPMPSVDPVISPTVVPPAQDLVDNLQLEFNFTEPNQQTQMILSEIKNLNVKINTVIKMLEKKKPGRLKK